MRKAQKEMALEHIRTQYQAHEQIKNFIKENNAAAAMDLLGMCQQGALELGNLIEQIEGEDFSTIRLLEGYCEEVYRMYEELGAAKDGGAADGGHIDKILQKWLVQIENSIKNDITVRIEVVFLPYKASMWDSMESVWKAAAEDENCDAYVIPIPYYDKNQDGSFRKEQWEVDQYPAYVPVTGYRDYDFEKRRPDIILIHNPYDECNYVTSVHPFFYSENLKRFTDKLIYIPYFILQELEAEDPKAAEIMENFCDLPAVINADQVIVQSEAMRQIYINVMSGLSGEDTRCYWEKKILGLGSPKVDKVLNTRKEELEIPKEWMEIIRKPDGSWKKIVFYNTTVTALLQYGAQMFKKMKHVFEIFKENQEEVALLWRPHPLIKETIESMRPQLWEEYRRITEEYQTEGWGIYDETADMNRAVCLSDAYYGDWSSVGELYKKTGKMILLQNAEYLPYSDGKI